MRNILQSQMVVVHVHKDVQFVLLQVVLVILALVAKMITTWILVVVLPVHLLAKTVPH